MLKVFLSALSAAWIFVASLLLKKRKDNDDTWPPGATPA